jgi:Tfp pilus assembly protein PilF
MRLILLVCLVLVGCASKGPSNEELSVVHFRVGTSHLEKGNYPEALRDLLQAEALNPRDPLIHNNLGLAYFLRERYELSEQHFRKAIALEPTFTDAKNNLARVLIERSQYKEARKRLDDVLADLTYPQPTKAYVNYGLSYFREQNYSEAREAFLKAISFDRENCLAQNYYGRSLLELKESSKAVQVLDRAAGFCLKSNFDEPIYFSAIAYYRLGDRLKAQSRLETLVQKNSPYKDKAETMLEILRK